MIILLICCCGKYTAISFFYFFKETNVSTIEEKINSGQVEELIEQAERELKLIDKMEEWKPWEPLVAEPPPGQWEWN